MMTILEWMKASTRYGIEDITFKKIAFDREITDADLDDASTLTVQQKELLQADIIFTAILLSPSNTSSISASHNGYQKTVGAEYDTYRNEKLAFAMYIYKKYNDPKYDLINTAGQKIKLIPIEDVI